jgi:hypothetical protein
LDCERYQSDGSIKLTQDGLIKRIVASLGIEHEPGLGVYGVGFIKLKKQS